MILAWMAIAAVVVSQVIVHWALRRLTKVFLPEDGIGPRWEALVDLQAIVSKHELRHEKHERQFDALQQAIIEQNRDDHQLVNEITVVVDTRHAELLNRLDAKFQLFENRLEMHDTRIFRLEVDHPDPRIGPGGQ